MGVLVMVLLMWPGDTYFSRQMVSSERPHHVLVAVAVPLGQKVQPPGSQRPSDTVSIAAAVPVAATKAALIAVTAGAVSGGSRRGTAHKRCRNDVGGEV